MVMIVAEWLFYLREFWEFQVGSVIALWLPSHVEFFDRRYLSGS